MPYSGAGKFPYWMTIGYNGTSGAAALSELVPVIADGTTLYGLTATAAMSSATWASGASVKLTFFDASGSQTGTSGTATSGSLTAYTAGTTTWSVTPLTAPANSVTVQATVTLIGTPSAANLLNVYQAQVLQTNSTAMAPVLNVNYGFASGIYSWTAVSNAILGSGYSPLVTADGNFDSLVIADTIELMGGPGGTPSVIPGLVDPASGLGVIYKVSAPGGVVSLSTGGFGTAGPYDLGAPQPTTDVIESLLLDGERPFGYRASNRTISIPVLIFAPTLATLAYAREYLLSQIDQQTWHVTWTPASTGLPMILECFRAEPSVITYGFNYNREGNPAGSAYALSVVTITAQALPYGKSGIDGAQQVDFAAGLIGTGTLPTAVTIDDYSSITTAGWTRNTSHPKNGSSCALHVGPVPFKSPPDHTAYSHGSLSKNITGLPVLSVWFGQSYDTSWPKDPKFISNVTLHWTLTDNNGQVLTFKVTHNKCPWGPDLSHPAWTRISARIPQSQASFNYSHVTAYSLLVTNATVAGSAAYVRMHAWLDTLLATTLSVAQGAPSPRAGVYTVYGLPNTARASVNAEIQLPAAAAQTQELTQSGTWSVPPGVTSVFAEAWGGGGAGGSLSGASGTALAGGGGGAEYAADTCTVIPGSKVPVTIGAGGTPVYPAALTATFGTAGTHKWTCPAGVTSVQAEVWGGGGAGTAGGGGGGGSAYAVNATVAVTAGKVYTLTVGAGGRPSTGKTAADNNARNGSSSSFPGDSVTVTAQGGKSPVVGASYGGDSGKGTSAGGTTIWWGGVGGTSPGGPGGGGGAAGSAAGRGQYGKNGAAGTGTAGGAGGTGASGAGSGGAGAGMPGVPVAGAVPGGGGGGGYTRGVNYQGAAGGAGTVKLAYTPAVANGGTTTFGSSGTTSPVVTAHGGNSVSSANAEAGATGGSGSSNAAHFSGGTGGLPASDALNRYLHLNLGALMTTLGSAAVTSSSASFTSSAYGGSTAGTGLALLLVTSAAALSGATVTDSAGNDYKLAGSVTVASSTVTIQAFYTPITNAITSGTTISLANSTATTYGYLWYASPYLIALEDGAALPSGSGTGTSASVTFPAYSTTAYPSGPNLFQVMAYANNNTAAFTNPGGVSNAGSTASVTSGTMVMSAAAIGVASPTALTWTATLASTGWAALGLPFAAANQEELITRLSSASSTTSTSSTVIALTTAPLFQASPNGLVVVVTEAAATSTITVTDSLSTTFTQVTQVQSGSAAFLHVHTGRPASAYSTANTITVSDNVSQTRTAKAYYVAGVASAYDASTNTGTGTTASITPTTGDSDGNCSLVIFASDSGNAVSGAPSSPFIDAGVQSSGNFRVNPYFAKVASTTDPGAVSATYGSSTTWGAISVRFRVSNVTPGGGGSSAGPGGAGVAAPPAAGAPAFTGGGKGAAGPSIANSAGVAASNPGGGGSGAKASTGSQLGGTGGNGLARLTYQPPLRTLSDWILHRPSDNAPQALSPVISIPPSDPPDNREYILPSLVPNASASFNGTYSVILVAHAFDSPGASRRVSATISQYEYANGPVISVQATRTFTPNVHTVNGYLTMGEVTLPVKDHDPANTEAYYTVAIHDTNQGDSYQDVLFLDTRGTTVFCNIAPGSAGDGQYSNYYVDEPSPDRDLGAVLGTAQGREHAISVLDMSFMTGGPLYVTSGDNTFLAYSTAGAPNLGLTYQPRWHVDRLQ